MKSLIFLIALLSVSGFVYADESTTTGGPDVIVSAPPPRPVDIDVDFQESYFKTKQWVNDFRYVIVINKALQGKEAQTIKVYEWGYLIKEEKVSTGREEWEPKGTHHSKKDMWTVTQTGYYSPTWLDKNHRSDSYGGIFSDIFGGTKMPYAIFFNGGTALHEVPKKAKDYLGQNVSGGCVRLPETLANDLFDRVKDSRGQKIPDFKIDGSIKTDSHGKYSYKEGTSFSTLVVVKNKIVN
jgi:hypothetical protein